MGGNIRAIARQHKKVCPFVTIRCPNNCGKMLLRKDLEQHKGECGSREVECDICNQKVKYNSLGYHQQTSCPKVQVKCKFCGEEMTREFLGKEGWSGRESHEGVSHDEYEYEYGLTVDDEFCTGHYAECSKMLLRCEFYDRGCHVKFKREDAAAHHAEKAHYHAALVGQTLARLYTWLDWDSVNIVWPIDRRRIMGSRRVVLKSSTTSGVSNYDLYLKLALDGPNDPIKISICSESMNCNPVYREVGLKKIHVQVTNDAVFMPADFAEFECYDKVRKIKHERNNPGAFEFSTTVKKKVDETVTEFTRSDLNNAAAEECYENHFIIRARFCIRKVSSVVVQCVR